MSRIKINHLLRAQDPMENVLIKGWVRTKRDTKTFSFLEINDGSCLKNLQVIVDDTLSNYAEAKQLTTGSAIAIHGNLIPSKGKSTNPFTRKTAGVTAGHLREKYHPCPYGAKKRPSSRPLKITRSSLFPEKPDPAKQPRFQSSV